MERRNKNHEVLKRKLLNKNLTKLLPKNCGLWCNFFKYIHYFVMANKNILQKNLKTGYFYILKPSNI